jgi:ATP-binding cassette subfamily A (ABC1) protein 3
LITDLTKTFTSYDGSEVQAVRSLNLAMYKDQIFSLLGHNGAGKTTTLNMLVGMLSPTGGNAYMLNYDIKTNMSEIRKKIGFCPQHGILYKEFTPFQHLDIFGTFKDMTKEDKINQINKLCHDLEMEEFKHRKVEFLSGG